MFISVSTVMLMNVSDTEFTLFETTVVYILLAYLFVYGLERMDDVVDFINVFAQKAEQWILNKKNKRRKQ